MWRAVLVAWNRQSTLFYLWRIWSIIEICVNYVNYERTWTGKGPWGSARLACSGSVVILRVCSSQAHRHDVRNGNNAIMCSCGALVGLLGRVSGPGEIMYALPGEQFLIFLFFLFSPQLPVFLLPSCLGFSSLMKKSSEILDGEKMQRVTMPHIMCTTRILP